MGNECRTHGDEAGAKACSRVESLSLRATRSAGVSLGVGEMEPEGEDILIGFKLR